ncbi:MAG: thiamine pyrophosphate-binding protein [Planctomycetes bacterium]|nr:thiamine pyrophosphate-binding protein [Planctomycetota bacterium]
MKTTGAKILVDALHRVGVERIFGIPGSQNLELYDELRDAKFEVILVTHEVGASFMADATARCTGKIGAFTTVPGPGMTNAFTGMGEALLDSAPIIAIIPDVRNDINETYQLHEIAQCKAAEPLVKIAIDLNSANEIAGAVAKAYKVAKEGDPGPAMINMPYNLLIESAEYNFQMPVIEKPQMDAAAFDVIRSAVVGASNPGIYVGQGVFGATDALRNIAEQLGAPVATTICGRGAIAEDHPLAVGFGFGPQGTKTAEEAFAKCDVILAVSCRFGEVATASYCMKPKGKVYHVDIDPQVLGQNIKCEKTLHADATDFLEKLWTSIKDSPRKNSDALQQKIAAGKKAERDEILSAPMLEKGVNPQRFALKLREKAARNAIMVTDSGHHQFIATPDFAIYEPRSFLTPADYQSMGYGVPALVACALAHRGRQTIGIIGDGGFLMTGFELITASRNEVNPVCCVFNDGKLDLISKQQGKAYGRDSLVKLHQPDYEGLARGFGAEYVAIESDAGSDAGIEKALAVKGKPVLVDVHIVYKGLPRFMKAALSVNIKRTPLGQKWRFGKRLIKRLIFGG